MKVKMNTCLCIVQLYPLGDETFIPLAHVSTAILGFTLCQLFDGLENNRRYTYSMMHEINNFCFLCLDVQVILQNFNNYACALIIYGVLF